MHDPWKLGLLNSWASRKYSMTLWPTSSITYALSLLFKPVRIRVVKIETTSFCQQLPRTNKASSCAQVLWFKHRVKHARVSTRSWPCPRANILERQNLLHVHLTQCTTAINSEQTGVFHKALEKNRPPSTWSKKEMFNCSTFKAQE